MTANNLINAAEALILDICINYQINPLEFKSLDNDEPIDLQNLCDEINDHFTDNNTQYIAIYFNRDCPTIAIEPANSHQELLDNYQFDLNINPDQVLKTIKVNIDGTNYTFELIPD